MALRFERTIDVAPHIFGGRAAALDDRDADFVLYSGAWLVGRVHREGGGPRAGRIFWSLTGPVSPQSPGPHAGDAGDIAHAQEQLVSAFQRWLAWAELQEAAPGAGATGRGG